MSNAEIALARLAVRDTIEDYLNFLDVKDWDGIAFCFSDDTRSSYNFEPQVLVGGRGVVKWLRARVGLYGATDHSLSNLHIVIDGDSATCDSRDLLRRFYGQWRGKGAHCGASYLVSG